MNRVVAVLLNRLMIWVVGGRLWELAQAWVTLYESKDIPAEEKRGRVLAMLQTEAQTLGLDLAQSLINLAIEAAVQYVRRLNRIGA